MVDETLRYIFKPNIIREGQALARFHTLEELTLEQAKLASMLFREPLPSMADIIYEQIQIVECAMSILQVDKDAEV